MLVTGPVLDLFGPNTSRPTLENIPVAPHREESFPNKTFTFHIYVQGLLTQDISLWPKAIALGNLGDACYQNVLHTPCTKKPETPDTVKFNSQAYK